VRALGEGLRPLLGELLPLRQLTIDGAACVACHAAPSDPLFRYLRTNVVNGQLEREIEIAGNPDFLFFGHTHWPLSIRSGKTVVINPGSVGQPKDGDPSAAYAVWTDGEVKLRRVAYDIEETVRAYAETPLDPGDVAALAEVLRTGGNLPQRAKPDLR
jgi:diadenosine tetraphosphatase ApaH/serine/threonine PP2A family protein phosphatase